MVIDTSTSSFNQRPFPKKKKKKYAKNRSKNLADDDDDDDDNQIRGDAGMVVDNVFDDHVDHKHVDDDGGI